MTKNDFQTQGLSATGDWTCALWLQQHSLNAIQLVTFFGIPCITDCKSPPPTPDFGALLVQIWRQWARILCKRSSREPGTSLFSVSRVGHLDSWWIPSSRPTSTCSDSWPASILRTHRHASCAGMVCPYMSSIFGRLMALPTIQL